jgi:hypothetical protein
MENYFVFFASVPLKLVAVVLSFSLKVEQSPTEVVKGDIREGRLGTICRKVSYVHFHLRPFCNIQRILQP